MTHYVVSPDGTVRSYKQQAVARAMALKLNTEAANNGQPQAAFPATDDDLGQIPTAVLVTLHNLIRPEKPIKKFADRETAEKRMKGVLEVLAKPGEAPIDADVQQQLDGTDSNAAAAAGDDTMATTKAKRAAKKTSAKKTTDSTGAGRPSAFAGKIIRKVADENPRREGTFGYKSWELIKNGMTYEKYIEAGGRRQDLAWDLEKGYVKLEKA